MLRNLLLSALLLAAIPALAVERLRRSSANSKVVILLTDGVQNAGSVDAEQAAELAVSQNIKVYCIGTGTSGLAPVPRADPFTGQMTLRPMYVEIDEETLRDVADKTGGVYYRATDKEALSQVYAEIDQLERTKITEIRYLQYTEHYVSFVIAGLALMTVAAVSGATVFRTLP